MAPIAEVGGSGPRVLQGNLGVEYGKKKTLLFPATQQAADVLHDIKTHHPRSKLTLKAAEDGSKLTIQRVEALLFTTKTNRILIVDPVAE